MHVILIAVGMHTNDYISSLTTKSYNCTFCNTDLILLQKKALGMQNTMIQKSKCLKVQDCSGFSQIGSHIIVSYQCFFDFSSFITHCRYTGTQLLWSTREI